jgi:tetratricopeptide (TPR) repeat protein
MIFKTIYKYQHFKNINTVESYIKNGDLLNAEIILTQTIKSYGKSKKALELYCKIMTHKAKEEDNFLNWSKVLHAANILDHQSIFKNKHNTYYYQGLSYYQMGSTYYSNSIFWLKKAITKQNNKKLTYEISKMLFEMHYHLNQHHEASSYLSELIQREPDNLKYQYLQACIALRKGEKKDAKKLLSDILFNNEYCDIFKKSAQTLLTLLTDLQLVDEKKYIYTCLMDKSDYDPEFAAPFGLMLYGQNKKYKARRIWYKSLQNNKKNQVLNKLLYKYH